MFPTVETGSYEENFNASGFKASFSLPLWRQSDHFNVHNRGKADCDRDIYVPKLSRGRHFPHCIYYVVGVVPSNYLLERTKISWAN